MATVSPFKIASVQNLDTMSSSGTFGISDMILSSFKVQFRLAFSFLLLVESVTTTSPVTVNKYPHSVPEPSDMNLK
jgi:hypothetical protein